MANNFTDQLETDIANHFFKAGGAAAVAQPAGHELALYTSDPTETGTAGVEVAGGGYVREPVTFTAPATNGTAKRIQNSAQLNFPQASANWGTITHYVVWTTDATKKPYLYGPLTAAKTIATGDVFQVPAGNLTADFD